MGDPAELMNGFCEDCIRLHLLDPPDKHERYIRLRAALLAALSPAPTVPEGWRLVPVEPTKEMEAAGWIDKEDVCPCDIYAAMIAAAPEPTT